MSHQPLPLMALLLAACAGGEGELPQTPLPNQPGDANIFVAVTDLGDPIPGLGPSTLASYERGREVMSRAFRTDQGLGPTFNADSCASCHQFPVGGGSAPRYRDFWLVKAERWDGTLEDVGSNGTSPVRNLYNTHPSGHVSEPADTTVYARRNTPSGFGIGLLEFIADEEILKREDVDDGDGDGISGKANYEQGEVGRFGYKAQAASMESFNRGAMLNQMGLTSNPLFHEFTPLVEETAVTWPQAPTPLDLLEGAVPAAHAQVSAPGQPTIDDDDTPDPEMSDTDQLDLLVFSTYVAPPAPKAQLNDQETRGAALFDELACSSCHTPRLESSLGPLPLYSDLLLHDMGPDRADGIAPGFSEPSEFRTQPLWGVVLHGPFLHDGAADTLEEAIALHGGEGEPSATGFAALSADDQAALVAFLEALGGARPDQLGMTAFEGQVPDEGDPGGPIAGLSDDDYALWLEGRELFDRNKGPDDGMSPYFNADSCRACHQDPVLGGAGGIDTNVIRIGHWNGDGYEGVGMNGLPRVSEAGLLPLRMPDEVNLIEPRQPPTVLGVGAISTISDATILAGEDPADADGDGISGRARVLESGEVGRYGWKAQIPSVYDFAADALLQELGITVDPGTSDFTVVDDGDAHPDPEAPQELPDALTFYLLNLDAPARQIDDAAAVQAGEALFADVGCASCHTPELDGVALYSDLLLHDICPEGVPLVDQEEGVEPGEFRTPPLWGIKDTAPYLHDGTAPTLRAAIEDGHAREAAGSTEAWLALTEAEQEQLLAFLRSL